MLNTKFGYTYFQSTYNINKDDNIHKQQRVKKKQQQKDNTVNKKIISGKKTK